MYCTLLSSTRLKFIVELLRNEGDSAGNIHFIALHPEFGASTELGSKKKNQILFAEALEVILILPDNYCT